MGRRLLLRPVELQTAPTQGDAPSPARRSSRSSTPPRSTTAYTPSLRGARRADHHRPGGPGIPAWTPQKLRGQVPAGRTRCATASSTRSTRWTRAPRPRDVGMPLIAEYAKRFGIYDGPAALPLVSRSAPARTTLMRMTTAYSMLANGGRKIKSTLIDRIQGPLGAHTIYKHDRARLPELQRGQVPGRRARAVAGRQARAGARPAHPPTRITSINGGRDPARHRRPASRRSASTSRARPAPRNDAKDLWFVGLFAGSRRRRVHGLRPPALSRRFGRRAALYTAPIFRDFMQMALKNKPDIPFPRAAGHQADSRSGRPLGPALDRRQLDPRGVQAPAPAPPEGYSSSQASSKQLDSGDSEQGRRHGPLLSPRAADIGLARGRSKELKEGPPRSVAQFWLERRSPKTGGLWGFEVPSSPARLFRFPT